MSVAGDPWRLNADLHCHSHVSDGVLPPAVVAQRAVDAGVQMLALTDHDELGGLAAARAVAQAAGIRFVPGVEISVTFAGKTVHIVGLHVDEHNTALRMGLAGIRAGREGRAQGMAAGLAAAGLKALDGLDADAIMAGASKYAENPQLISRTHFARFLIERGAADDPGGVFMRYLTEGKPGYVEHRWATLPEAVGWIRAAGGQAVIAHPGRYRMTDTERWALFSQFKELGGTGVEVVTASHTKDQYRTYALVAREYGLLASRGSDFHSPDESRVNLGELPLLPDSVVPIWHDW